MTKIQAIEIFGNSKQFRDCMGMSRQSLCQLPDELTQAMSDRVIGCATRYNLKFPKHIMYECR